MSRYKITKRRLAEIIKEEYNKVIREAKTGRGHAGDSAVEDYHDMVIIRKLLQNGMKKSKLLQGERLDRWLDKFDKDMN